MNVNTITVDAHTARLKLDEYKSIKENQRTTEDALLERTYRAVANGAKVIDIGAAFKTSGLNDQGQPRLAIARADGKQCHFHPSAQWHSPRFGDHVYLPGFTIADDYDERRKTKNVVLPPGTFDGQALTGKKLRTPVPHIPPSLRPPYKLENYHILFEVKSWEEYNTDPYLLRRISSSLFVVIGEWELTELEAALLGAMAK